MNIVKQTIANMRQQPLLTGLTIIGTALAICLIMIVVMTREVQLIDYGNEPNRSRTLYATASHISRSDGGNSYNSCIEVDAVNKIFMNLKSAEAVAAFSLYARSLDVSVQGKESVFEDVLAVNTGFFRVFRLNFIEGKPFTEEECDSNMPIAILSRSMCREVFGKEDGLTGQTFLINNHEYRVSGIVEDVSQLFKSAYSRIWVPTSTTPNGYHPLLGSLQNQYLRIAILAKSKDDFPDIRKEMNRNLMIYNKGFSPDTLDLMEAPDEQEVYVNRVYSNEVPDMDAIYLRYVLMFAILLIVPAINIASMTQSRLRQREVEIGVRRAFGAKRSTILLQTITESMILTIAAGILGLVLCVIFCSLLGDFIFSSGRGVLSSSQWWKFDFGILFSPKIYGWTLLFCVLINILSSTIPAWKASRGNIVEALK